MRLSILTFAAGIGWLQLQPALPDIAALAVMAVAGVLLLALSLRLRAATPVAAFLLGIAWAGALAHHRLADFLPAGSEGRDTEVVGVIASLPQYYENGLRFDFDVEHSGLPAPRRISLAWHRGFRPQEDGEVHAAPPLHAGERWRFTVRLKRPHGNLNPHGFDYEAMLFERGIRATGYVRPKHEFARLDEFVMRPSHAIERLRERIRERFLRVLPDQPYAGILVALAIGDQRAIDASLWQVFARTGVTHLMSISGLHVTMVAGLAAWIVSWNWRRRFLFGGRLPLLLPAQKAAAIAGFAAAFAYCLLAGFAVPAQRTLTMLGVVALALATGRATAPSRVLALALLIVLLLDPWAVLSPGFWLSFGAVGLLFYIGSGRLGEIRPLAAWGRAQWAMTLGLVPALLALFQQFSLVSPIANAVAIPMVSFVATPLALLGAIPLLDPLLWLAHQAMAALMWLLEWLAASGWAVWQQHAPPVWTVALALGGAAWLLMPRGFPVRWVGLAAFLPMLLVPPPRPMAGEANVTVLDVGQGLAVHVQTAGHDLLYDTGPAFSPDANSGNRIIVPYLRASGVRRLDGLVVTHADKDHSGGAASVLESVPTGWLMTSLPGDHPLLAATPPRRPCADGDAWEWDGVRFQLLHPTALQFAQPIRKTNDMSCVLKVTSRHGTALLTSDIEAISEAALLARHGDDLHAEVLVAPHHGSRTSSTPEFVAGVGAREVIFPVGYRNRFGHPKEEVVARYAGTRCWRTDADGALTVRLTGAGVAVAPARAERRRYWHSGVE
ncbi:MAG: DNA internalization-related competence protein ComEC/Rec2 [Candidatus Nitricoxidivorans perseverans]|uniref:DNA internalization-related competence protein ComEC/Rec2 n=1 Tax=Candidatus Nitricoxidivorans perseverans TaxID=2975601 RepID=A0AA49IW48_9PROT|nr:MAG: DNA internalization-related competence protein ComEC/Rec2 [Candidatus Nitricoxidivorans perseverans]